MCSAEKLDNIGKVKLPRWTEIAERTTATKTFEKGT